MNIYSKKLIIIFMIIMIPYCLNLIRIGNRELNISEDFKDKNFEYIHSNNTLIFDNLYLSSQMSNIFPLVYFYISHKNFTLILKNENSIIVNDLKDFYGIPGFYLNFWNSTFVIQGDGKLFIKVDFGRKIYDSYGFEIENKDSQLFNFMIKENVKIEILINNGVNLTGLRAGPISMSGNSQLSVYIGNNEGSSYGIRCQKILLSDNVTINSSLSNVNDDSENPQWFLAGEISLSNYTNVTFITNGTMKIRDSFFNNYLSDNPIIINAIETLDEFNKSHKLTQKDPNKPIIFSNYFTKKKEEKIKNKSQFIKISFFLLNMILFI